MNRQFNVANAVGFQLLWWSLILFGNIAILLALTVVSLHFIFLRKFSESGEPVLRYEFKAVAAVSFIGVVLDLTLAALGFFSFSNGEFFPMWLPVLWVCFACTSRHSLKWFFSSKPGLLILAVFGLPVSYIAAEGLGAVGLRALSFFEGPHYFVFLAHGILFVLLCRMAFSLVAVNSIRKFS